MPKTTEDLFITMSEPIYDANTRERIQRFGKQLWYSQSEVDELIAQEVDDYSYEEHKIYLNHLAFLQKELKDVFCEREELGITDFKEGNICVCVPCQDIDSVFSKYLKGGKDGN